MGNFSFNSVQVHSDSDLPELFTNLQIFSDNFAAFSPLKFGGIVFLFFA